MKFSVILPAYNEEEAIAPIVEETLAALKEMKVQGRVTDTELIVVNDGSADRTAEIVSQFREVKLISYEKNRGYGAALKEGFEQATGEILGFMDADGTCRPAFFGNLLQALAENNADIALGSRLGENSNMPKVRKLGNMIFARMINYLYSVRIQDCASGMRVFKKNVLDILAPLPDGLHYTPAMSCKALMEEDVRMVEVVMPYQERKGQSKLHVGKDGIRFLKTIIELALFYKPLKFMFSMGACCIIISLLYAFGPLIQYITSGQLEFSYIYRFITVIVLSNVGVNFMLFGIFAQRLLNLVIRHGKVKEKQPSRFFELAERPSCMLVSGFFFSFLAIILNYQGLYNYLTKGRVMAHWFITVIGGVLLLMGVQLIVFGLLHKIINLYQEHK